MKLNKYIQDIEIHLINTHSNLLGWFELGSSLKSYRPIDGGWTILEILEHVSLTSHFLMKLINKGASKALKNLNNLDLKIVLDEFDYDLSRIEEIGIHKSFDWMRPEHMEPTGNKSELEIKNTLINQLNNCLSHLNNLKEGQGLLYNTTMTVNGLGKLNVYEYIYFLSKHGERHLNQMNENVQELEREMTKG